MENNCATESPTPSWLNEEGVATLSRGYLLPEETARGMHTRLSSYAAKILDRPDLEQDFFDIFWNGWLGPATPVASVATVTTLYFFNASSSPSSGFKCIMLSLYLFP